MKPLDLVYGEWDRVRDEAQESATIHIMRDSHDSVVITTDTRIVRLAPYRGVVLSRSQRDAA